MTDSDLKEKTASAAEAGMPVLTDENVLPERANQEWPPIFLLYKYRYTTGPFLLPQNSGSLDWALLNNDSTRQTARVTVFKCPVGMKTPEAPGPLVVAIEPGETTHNANKYKEGFYYEVQVECNSNLVFPYVSVWPANFGLVIPGTGINSGTFIRLMP